MTLYSQKTLADVYQDIALKLGTARLVEVYDLPSFSHFVASAMIDVVNFSLPFHRWEYVKSMVVDDLDAIPTEFLIQQRLLLGTDPESGQPASLDPNKPTYVEARFTDIREFFNLALSKNSMNRASYFNPIYTLWGMSDGTGGHNLTIRIAPDTMSGLFEYYEMPVFPVAKTDKIFIPYEYESLLEDIILSQYYLRLKDFHKLETIHQSISNRKNELVEEFKKYNETKVRELGTFVVQDPNQVNFQSKKR